MSPTRLPLFAVLLVMAATTSAAATANPESNRTAEGVRAVEARWSQAFLHGDEVYLNQLLDPGYISVNQSGAPRAKVEIIALARKIAAQPPKDYGPVTPGHVEVHGSAAIVTFGNATDRSVDVFHYDHGAWHAWYSQHTAVK